MKTPTERDTRLFLYKESLWKRFWNRHGYDAVPDLSGLSVLDVGTGRGSNAIAAASNGANVLSLDPSSDYISIARDLTYRFHPEVADRIEYRVSTVEEYDGTGEFDYIICDEVFEHMLDLPRSLDRMAELLKPGGKILSGWGPLWKSPVGGHRLTPYLHVRVWPPLVAISTKSAASRYARRWKVPFLHRVCTKRFLAELSDNQGTPVRSIRDAGMNGLAAHEFKQAIEESPLRVIRWRENVGSHWAYSALRLLAGIPGLSTHFTSNVYAVLAHENATSE